MPASKRLRIGLFLLVILNPTAHALYDNDAASQDKTAAGQDKNRNGIRDDIDLILKQSYSQPPAFQKAAVAFARILQRMATHPARNRENAQDVMNQLFRASTCLAFTSPENLKTDAGTRLTAATFNTVQRLRNDETYEKLSSGTAFTMPHKAECGG